MFNRWLRFLESAPLTAFVLYVHTVSLQPGWDWLLPYALASLLGLAISLLLLQQRLVLDRLFLAINLYFLSGLIAVAAQLHFINQLYGQLGAAAMIGWILLLGLYVNLFCSVALLGVEEPPPPRGAWILWGACWCAGLWSIVFKEQVFLGEWLPFIALFTLKGLLSKRVSRE